MGKLLAQNLHINSFNGNVVCVNNVCYNLSGNAGAHTQMGCHVVNGKIYKNGKYLRDVTAADYKRLQIFSDQSFPWDPRNPSHTEFPWNMFSSIRAKRRSKRGLHSRVKRLMPFPEVPYLC
uniref:Pepsin inhibitor-3-like repeated domain-containing protein n=1 Tax=Setaria digitata TaxID=48799 RepID=A0A915PGB1_9BILA